MNETPNLMESMNSINNHPNNNKPKKEINLWLGLGIIIIVATIIGVLIYFLYIKDNSKKEIKPTNTPTATATPVPEVKDEVLQVTDSSVQTLFGYIKDSIIQRNFVNTPTLVKYQAKELSAADKNYIAYLQIPASERKNDTCANYPNIVKYNRAPKPIYQACGVISNGPLLADRSLGYDDSKNATLTISEDVLQAKVEMIFGPKSYVSGNFKTEKFTTVGYEYDASTKTYVHTTCVECGGTGPIEPKSTLVSALKTANNIQIVESLTGENINIKIKHVFTNVNGNYYFDYSELTN